MSEPQNTKLQGTPQVYPLPTVIEEASLLRRFVVRRVGAPELNRSTARDIDEKGH